MARNEVWPFTQHKTQVVPVPAGTKAGEAVRVGIINGVALVDRADSATFNPTFAAPLNHLQNPGAWGGGNVDGNATIAVDGGWEMPVIAGAAPAIGDQVYIITASRLLTVTASGNQKFGVIVRGRSGTAPVDLTNGSFTCVVEPRQY